LRVVFRVIVLFVLSVSRGQALGVDELVLRGGARMTRRDADGGARGGVVDFCCSYWQGGIRGGVA
jgi:hypothetical protein